MKVLKSWLNDWIDISEISNEDISEGLESLGFEIEEIIPNGNYFEYLAQEVRRIKNVALEYSSKNLNIFYKIGIYLVLVLLGSLSKKDKGSHELLNFGYFVKAKKI